MSARVKAMPVASGTTVTEPMSPIPAIVMASMTSKFVSFARRDDPAGIVVNNQEGGGGGGGAQSQPRASCSDLLAMPSAVVICSAKAKQSEFWKATCCLWLLCCDITRPPNSMRHTVVPLRHQRTRYPGLALPDPDVVDEVVAVHESHITQE